MIIPYSTDAPIYHFPWMTIALIVINCITFAITGMGHNDEGWLLQYGNGLHPLEWVAYNFLHFGIGHLLGNMFFLWAFGIVVEGKLGWWKFLCVYMSIGIFGGALIQLTMLGYKPMFDMGDFASSRETSSPWSWLEPTPAFAQDDDGEDGPDMDGFPAGPFPGIGGNDDQLDPKAMKELQRELMKMTRPGAGGASLVVFALLGMVLVWAPKNEISCLWIGLNAGTFEMEYVYFCGFKIGAEIIGSVIGAHGYEVTSEIAHALGAILGFGVAAAFVKLNWVDCENWDLFAYAQNKHGAVANVGAWQDTVALASLREKKVTANNDDDDGPRILANKKRRAMPKLQSLSSLDDEVPSDEAIEVEGIEVIEESPSSKKNSPKRPMSDAANAPLARALLGDGPSVKSSSPERSKKPAASSPVAPLLPPLPSGLNSKPKAKPEQVSAVKSVSTSKPSDASKRLADSQKLDIVPPLPSVALSAAPGDTSPLGRIRSAINADKPGDALAELRRQRAADPDFQLPAAELRGLSDAFFKQQNVRDSKPLLEEFIARFPKEADRQKVKLAVLNVKFLKRPTAAIKLLAQVDRSWLADEYQPIHKAVARQAQQMISEGIVDAS